jgi:diphosphomevalonate decarboxylase
VKITTAYANANIALVKYWGKSDNLLNIPAVSSLSMTLDNIGTTVSISTSASKHHELVQDGKVVTNDALSRLSNYLELSQSRYNYTGFFRVSTRSNVPYGAGLASSAAFFAALACALNSFNNLNLSRPELSRLARLGSGSAARSIFANFVGLYGGDSGDISDEEAFAFEIVPARSFKLAMLLGVISSQPKAISSRAAMIHTQKSSPFYAAWCATSQHDFISAQKALKDGSLESLGPIVEYSTLKMHASILAAQPAINYLAPESLGLISLVQEIRKNHGPIAFFTMDAGPNVKIICEVHYLELIKNIITHSALCSDVRVSYPGRGAFISDEHIT